MRTWKLLVRSTTTPKGKKYHTYAMGVPAEFAGYLKSFTFTAELTAEGLLYRPIHKTKPFDVPDWALEAEGDPGDIETVDSTHDGNGDPYGPC